MLVDPISVAASAPNPMIVLASIRQDNYGSERIDTNGGGYSTLINHTKNAKGDRHYIQLSLGKNATDPYSALVRKQNVSVSVTINRPSFGFTDDEVAAVYKALTDLIALPAVTVKKLIQFQS